jgi:hypothetical protein
LKVKMMLKTQAVAGEVEEVPHDGEEKPGYR